MKPRIIFLVGPTAAGKTDIAIKLAKKINAEIISCDSMQIYKGMDILTSKPTAAQRNTVKHHLTDFLSAKKDYDVSRYNNEVSDKIEKIIKKGKQALLVGGTGLYVSILIDGIFKESAENNKIRDRLYEELGKSGSKFLYKRLQRQDPEAASKIHPHDAKRIIRALEVFENTGKRISYLQKQRKGLAKDYDIIIFGLNMDRDKLYKRIDARVDKMFRLGLVREVKNLLRLRLGRTAGYAIGIRELKGHFDGLYDLGEARRLIKRNTRHYAKRQLTWFRKDKRLNWIEVKEKDKPQAIAQKIWKELS